MTIYEVELTKKAKTVVKDSGRSHLELLLLMILKFTRHQFLFQKRECFSTQHRSVQGHRCVREIHEIFI